ncbi:MAG: rod shape-determining protein RodA [Thermodesulfovibrionales bacterium]|nr:rod shape-determining protein RodA [Thermodesulfovibrionales bacterium]
MLKIDRRLIKNFDWITLSIIFTLSIIGIMTIYSATRPPIGMGSHPDFYLKQILWLLISLFAIIAVVTLNYIWLYRFSYPFYGLGLLLLLIVLFAGRTGMGAQRWLSIGVVSFQPSEFFRLFFIIGFSAYLTNIGQHHKDKVFIKSLLIFAVVPLILLIKQPDLGTAVLLMSLFFVLIISKGISKKIIILFLIIGLISVPFLGHIFWEGLKDYQKNRITAFIDPDIDPAGIGYHINQSKVSVGSGKFLGKGYLKGTQGPLRFLPEKHTDFIFSVFAEEWGFIGSILLIGVYLLLFLRGLDTSIKAKDEFGKFVAVGITTMFFTYFCVNIGMTLGIMPVVGVPLPFMSYGGTALLSNFIAAGILISIRTKRFELFYP